MRTENTLEDIMGRRTHLWQEDDESEQNGNQPIEEEEAEQINGEPEETFVCDEGHEFTEGEAESHGWICPEEGSELIPKSLY